MAQGGCESGLTSLQSLRSPNACHGESADLGDGRAATGDQHIPHDQRDGLDKRLRDQHLVERSAENRGAPFYRKRMARANIEQRIPRATESLWGSRGRYGRIASAERVLGGDFRERRDATNTSSAARMSSFARGASRLLPTTAHRAMWVSSRTRKVSALKEIGHLLAGLVDVVRNAEPPLGNAGQPTTARVVHMQGNESRRRAPVARDDEFFRASGFRVMHEPGQSGVGIQAC